jgi:endonuclease/exonuclease/phosphatase family metal-dependent hydrolase
VQNLRQFALVSFAVAQASGLWAHASPAQAPVRVMTFNIRYGTANDGAHRWPNRAAHVIATIRDYAPHVLGIQEALRFQLDELGRALPGYREFGVGREDGLAKGEYAALLIDTTRFTPVADGHFWYSDTPAVPSKHWGNNVIRICTWVRVVDRATRDTLRFYNSHWDHESQPSRVKSAEALLARIAADSSRRDGVLVFGDFNTDEANPAFRSLISDARVALRDTFRAKHPNATVVGTFNSFRGDSTQGKIDAILATPRWDVIDASIDRRRFGELWASDHFAVTAILRYQR